MKSIIRIALALIIVNCSLIIANAQVAINSDGASPDASAMLDVTSSDKGMLVPRMTTSEREAISSPATGLLVYDTDENSFWYYESSQWIEIANHQYTDTISSPEYTNTVNVGNELNHMLQDGNYLYILDEDLDDVFVYDISTPSAPTLASSLSIANSGITNFVIDGDYIYVVGTGTYDFHVIDISDPTNISLLGSHTLGNTLHAIEIDGSYAYVLDWSDEKLRVIDISTPSSPAQVGDFTVNFAQDGPEFAMTIENGSLYIGHKYSGNGLLTIIDITTPSTPSQIVSYTVATFQVGATGLIKRDDYLYFQRETNISIVDVSTASSPSVVSNGFSSTAIRSTIYNDYLFADQSFNDYEIDVFDISSPTAPTLLYTFDKPRSTFANAMLVYEGYLFTAESDGNLDIYQVTEPYVNALGIDGTVGNYPLYDDLGDHKAAENIQLSDNWLSNDGDDEGISISDDGNTTLSGTLTIGQNYTLPSTDGSASQVLITDGSGTVSWSGVSAENLSDADGDTKIQVEESSNEDIIRFDLGGSEVIRFEANSNDLGRIYFNEDISIGQNAGYSSKVDTPSIFIGKNAGYYNQGTENLFIGENTGYNNVYGIQNILLGTSAGFNSTGDYNTFLGTQAGYQNTGDKNVFLGYLAGFSETGSNKLYIENSTSSSPLIYGEFDNDLLQINGTLNISGNYVFPTTDGSASQILTTDGSGSLSWTDFSLDILSDADGDTKIQVEESSDEDIIRFDLGGTEFMRLDSGRIEMYNVGRSVFLGEGAGESDDYGDNQNVFVGHRAGTFNTSGELNVFIGQNAGRLNTTGSNNTFIGYQTGYANTTGSDNAFFGWRAGLDNTTGQSNTFIGYKSGFNNTEGNNSVMLGYEAGFTNTTGVSNVFLGYRAGYSETGSNKLYIENSTSSSPLIYGEFDNNRIVINGNDGDNSNNRTLFVNGSIGATSAFNNDSDRRLKTNISTIPNALDKVLEMRGVTYQWKDGREQGDRMGFIAQEVEPILPQVVDNQNDHYTMQYAPITAVLVEAVKEQQAIIEKEQQRSKALEQKVIELEQQLQKVNELEAKLEALINNSVNQ